MLEFSITEKSNLENLNRLNPVGIESWETEFFGLMQPSYVAICEDNNKLIGSEGYIGYQLIKDEKEVTTHRSERTIVNPEYRGQGIFEKLVLTCDRTAIKDNSAFCWGATSALKPFKRAGFNGFTGFRTYIFYPIKKNLIKKIFSKINLSFFNPIKIFNLLKNKDLNELKNLLSFYSLVKPIKNLKNSKIQLVEYNYENVKGIIYSNDVDSFKINPTNKFLKWLNHKGNKYIKHNIVLNEEAIGYLILKNDYSHKYISIVDIYFQCKTTSLAEILSSLSEHKAYKNYHSIFLALNNANKTHNKWVSSVKNCNVITITKAGSFVIKPLKETIKIDSLLLTDLWLEL